MYAVSKSIFSSKAAIVDSFKTELICIDLFRIFALSTLLMRAVPVQAQCGTYYLDVDCYDDSNYDCNNLCGIVCADVNCGLSIGPYCNPPPEVACVCTCVPNVAPALVKQT